MFLDLLSSIYMFLFPELLYRTDFFPGLGWMLEKKIWRELENKWPNAYVAWLTVSIYPFCV